MLSGNITAILTAWVAIPGCAYGQAASSYTVGTESIAAGEREPDGYQKVGIGLGDFTLSPNVVQSVGYNSNVNANSANKVSSGYFSFVPSVNLRSNWSTNLFDVHADYGTFRYFAIPLNDYTVYGGGANGRLDISHDTQLTATASIGKRVEPRGTEGDTLLQGPPISYRLISTSGGLTQDLGRFQVLLSGNYSQYHYHNTVVNGVPINLSFRNNQSYVEDARINYGLSPQIALFIDGAINQSRYSAQSTIGDDSHGLQVLGGVSFAVTSLISGELGLGYLHQKFNSPLFPPDNGLDYRAQVVWNFTALSTLTLQAGRSVERSPLVGVGGIIASNVGVVVDHELRRNVLLRGGVSYTSNSYTGTSQVNHRLGLNASIRYLVNRNITLALTNNYSHQRLGGTVISGVSYAREQIGLSLAIGL